MRARRCKSSASRPRRLRRRSSRRSWRQRLGNGRKSSPTPTSRRINDFIDLRNNPGGLLDQAVSVSDAFLEKGEIVSTRGRSAEETQRFNARAGDLIKNRPVIVLINGGSASASEIVAGGAEGPRRGSVHRTPPLGHWPVATLNRAAPQPR